MEELPLPGPVQQPSIPPPPVSGEFTPDPGG